MKIHTYQITTKAFQIRVRVQGGRIVDIHHLLGMYKKNQYNRLLAWLEKNHPGFTVEEQQGPRCRSS